MEVLLVGGTGFIGRALAGELLRRGHRARVLSRSSPDRSLPEGVPYFRGDVTTADGIAEAATGCGGLVFLAGREDVPWLPAGDRDGAAMFAVNVLGTHRTLSAAREVGARCAVVVTSCITYGVGPDGEPVDGAEPPGVVGLHGAYAHSRIQQELAALETARPDFAVTCVGPSSVVGPGDDKFFGRLVRAIDKLPTPAVPRGGFNFIAVQDVAVGLANLLEGRGQRPRYLFVAENMTFREVLGIIRESRGRSAPRFSVAPAAIRAATSLANLLGTVAGRVSSMPEAERYLNQRVYYDGRLAVSEIGLPQTPVRAVIRETLRAMGMS